MIELCGLTKRYGDHVVFENFSATMKEGDINCLMGASGSGKTTLLRLLAGLEKPEEGEIRGLSGKRVAVVFQENRLCEGFDAVTNVAMVLKGKDRTAEIKEEFLRLGLLTEDLHKKVKYYSGGMKRRVAVLRCMMAESDLILLDEPFKGLDQATKEKTMELIWRLKKDKTVVLATHEKEDAYYFKANLIVL